MEPTLNAEYVVVSESHLPRWMHRLYAFVTRYFWKPCPRCGRPFGGHEPHGESIPVEGECHTFWITCCARNDGSECAT